MYLSFLPGFRTERCDEEEDLEVDGEDVPGDPEVAPGGGEAHEAGQEDGAVAAEGARDAALQEEVVQAALGFADAWKIRK